MTQPVHTQAALENLKEAHACLDAKILGGVMPVVSYRNACFMNSEVAGITVDEKIVEALRDKNREEGEALALSVAARIAREMYPYVDGYYLITPFLRTGLMAKLIAAIRALEAE